MSLVIPLILNNDYQNYFNLILYIKIEFIFSNYEIDTEL